MSNITKGKWEATPIYGDHWTVSVDGRIAIDCFSNEANARLIAEAPEMFDMLHYLLGYVREWEKISSGRIYKAKVQKDIKEVEELLARIDGKEINNA